MQRKVGRIDSMRKWQKNRKTNRNKGRNKRDAALNKRNKVIDSTKKEDGGTQSGSLREEDISMNDIL